MRRLARVGWRSGALWAVALGAFGASCARISDGSNSVEPNAALLPAVGSSTPSATAPAPADATLAGAAEPRGPNATASPASGPSPAAPEVPSAPPKASSFEPGSADLDPDNDLVVAPPAPIADCESRLERAQVRFTRATLPLSQKRGATYTCGAEQVVVYRAGPHAIRYNAAPLFTCGMALAWARFEAVLSEEAQRAFGQPVARIEQGGTYNCRKMARFRDLVSEHSYGNAIDVRSITLKNGKKISVLAHFGALDAEPRTVEGAFLRTLVRRLYDEGVFSVVLTRFFDPLHRDHFHFDLARYRVDGTR